MKKELCIATYNVRHGGDVPANIACIGKLLSNACVDIAGLQEIDVGTRRMCGANVLAEIAEGGSYPYTYFAKAMEFDGGEYGIGIVSRYPILCAQAIPLFSGNEEPRVLACAVIKTEWGSIDFFNTHTSYESQKLRATQLQEIGARLAQSEHFVLTGDFNTADAKEFSAFPPCLVSNCNEFGSFYSTGEGIDNIFVAPSLRILQSTMPTAPYSDHYPILSLLEKR